MNHDAIRLTQDALWLVLFLSGPAIAAAAFSGLLVAFVQAVTQLQEQTVAFAVKLVIVALILYLMSGLMGETLFQFSERIFSGFPGMVHK